MATITPTDLTQFVTDSNEIEGILRKPTREELDASAHFLCLEMLSIGVLTGFVYVCQPDARLRTKVGMDVIVGRHRPPPGGPKIFGDLEAVLRAIVEGGDPYEMHQTYETLHPYTDGNGRSGRILWAWQMVRKGWHPATGIGFLRSWYYQSFDAARAK